jgi:hypothetical protein
VAWWPLAPVWVLASVQPLQAVSVSSEQPSTFWGRCLRGQVSDNVSSCMTLLGDWSPFPLCSEASRDGCPVHFSGGPHTQKSWMSRSLSGGGSGQVGVTCLFTSVTGPQDLVTQVFAVLLEYLESPDSSPTVQGQGWGLEGVFQRGAELLLTVTFEGRWPCGLWAPGPCW